MAPSVTAGMQVVSKHHPEWREGVVMGVLGANVRVFFVAHPSRKQVLVPTAAVTVLREGAWDAAQKSFDDRAALAATKARSASSSRSSRKWSKITQAEAEAKFFTEFPEGFADPKYVAAEREPRWKAHEAYASELGGEKLRALVASGSLEQLARAASDAEAKASLLSPFERSRFAAALREREPALAYFAALADLLAVAEVDEAAFRPYLAALEALPNAPKKRVDTWPIATLLPFLARPERHFFVKPNATRAAAERLQIDLRYESALNWATYASALQVANELRRRFEPRGCKDMIDAQVFVAKLA
ncbi:MAG: hypothetical protein ACJ79R_22315 [Anaeromyxobacteraceae bacterium]